MVIISFVWQVNIVKIFKKIGGNTTFTNITDAYLKYY